ncbi:MAG: glycosyltransferase family 9 protein [Gammaproteobacteria bacterium]
MSGSILVYVVGDRIGDAVIKLPVIAALRASFPRHRITWLAGRRASAFAGPLAPLVAGLIDEVRDRAGIGVSLAELLRRPPLRERFDIVIDTQSRLATTILLRRLAHGVFISPCAGFLLSDRRPAPGAIRPRSVRGAFLQLVELAAGRALPIDPVIRIDDGYRRAAAELLPPGPQYLGLAPGAGGARKRWPLENFIGIAQTQAAAGRVPVWFLGPDEVCLLDKLRAAVPQSSFPEQAASGAMQRGPLLAIALAGRLRAALSNDSGTGHLLAAAGIPTLTLFGHTDPAKFAGDAPNRSAILAADHGAADVAAIPVPAVAAALEAILARVPEAVA